MKVCKKPGVLLVHKIRVIVWDLDAWELNEGPELRHYQIIIEELRQGS